MIKKLYFLILISLFLLLSCSNYKSNQLHAAYKLKSNKIKWQYPTFAYSFLKVKETKEIRSSIDSSFYIALKSEISVIPQDSFYALTHEYRNNDSAEFAINEILNELNKYGVNFIIFPQYYNCFDRKLKSRGGFKIIIGKGYSSKPFKFEVVDSTSFFLAASLVYLDESSNLKIKTFNTQLPRSYIGRRNKYLPGEPDSFSAFELEAVGLMTREIGKEINDYINALSN